MKNLNGGEWNWDNISAGADNFGNLINTGLDIFGNVRSQFGRNNSGGSNDQQGSNTGQSQPIYITAPTSQQAGMGINNNTLMVIGGLVIGGLVLKNLMESRSPVYYPETVR